MITRGYTARARAQYTCKIPPFEDPPGGGSSLSPERHYSHRLMRAQRALGKYAAAGKGIIGTGDTESM